jgi:transcriptional regulator with XRE-family HTH domain
VPRDAEQSAALRAFGDRVRAVRIEKGMSQADVAHAAGLHPTYVSGIESGRRNASVLSLYAIAVALGVAPSELLPSPSGRGTRA